MSTRAEERTRGTSPDLSLAVRAGSVVDASWYTLASWRLATGLLLSLALAAAVGAAVLQAPPPALDDPDQYQLWLGLARSKYGVLAEPMDRLGLFYVYSSLWFRGTIGLLATSMTVSMCRRLPSLLSRIRRTQSFATPGYFEQASLRARIETAGPPLEAVGVVGAALRRYRFRAHILEGTDAIELTGEKNSRLRLATLVHHFGILLVLLAALTGGRGSFRESQFVVSVGSTRDVGHDTGLTIRVASFTDEYYSDGAGVPRDYRSGIEVLEGDTLIASGVARVNHPLVVRGIRIHQSFYGLAAVLVIRDEAGREVFEGTVPLTFRAEDRPAGSLQLPDVGLEVFVLAPMSGRADPVIEPGQVRLEVYPLGGSAPLGFVPLAQGRRQVLEGLEFTFLRETRFTGLQLLRAPSMWLVWLGAALVVVGAAVSVLAPHRRVRVRVDTAGGHTLVRVAATRGNALPFDDEFERVTRHLRAALDDPTHTKGRAL